MHLESAHRVEPGCCKEAMRELHSASDLRLWCRELLEDIMDDEDELKDFNLSSRVEREERRRQRERGRLERELERERARDRGEPLPSDGTSSRDGGAGDITDAELTTQQASPRPGGARRQADRPVQGAPHRPERFPTPTGDFLGSSVADGPVAGALEEAWAAPSGMRSERGDGDTVGCAPGWRSALRHPLLHGATSAAPSDAMACVSWCGRNTSRRTMARTAAQLW